MQLFDLHCDTLYQCYTKNYPLIKNKGHIDLCRAERYEKYVQAFAVWIPDTLRGQDAWEFCRRVLLFARREEERCNHRLHFLCKGETLSNKSPSSPRIGLLAVEGGAALAGDLSHIDELADLGVKYITITWNGANEWGNGCLSPDKSGLTPFGFEALRRCEAAGILPDVSHLNEAGFWDVAETLTGPFLATHSNAAAVCPHPRNLTDEQFAEICRRGGLVGINLCADFLGEQTFSGIERHLYHFWERGGEDTVCFGCDMDGTALPAKWGGLQVMEEVYAYLSRKNYDTALLHKLFFANCREFFD